MTQFRELKDASILNTPEPKTRQPSERTLASRKAQTEIAALVAQIENVDDVYQIDLDENEKPLTVRLRILKAAKAQGKNIVVRQHGKGLAVGLWTAERATRRGRKPKAK